MREARIKVKAFAVLLNRSLDAHLVWRGSDATKSPADFHRLLGGHVEFGESTIEAVRREILEETAAELQEPHLLGVLESASCTKASPATRLCSSTQGGWIRQTLCRLAAAGSATTVRHLD